MKCPLSLVIASLAVLLACGTGCANRLTAYPDLLVGVPAKTAPRPGGNHVSVTYLGVNGYLLRSGETAILVDPYFSRIGLREVIMNAPATSSDEAIAFAREEGAIPDHVDAFLITHCHFDHLFDVPSLQKALGGKVIVSETGVHLCEASGISRSDLRPANEGQVYQIGNATITILPAHHDLVLGKVPYPGVINEPLATAPQRPKEWLLGTPQAFIIEMGGARIYVESGGISGFPPPVRDVDLAIIGTAVGNTERYVEAVRALHPRYVLPSHQDNFFIPLRSGFQFSALSDFPRLKSADVAEKLPGDLVLMDYFHTWTLPEGRLPAIPKEKESVFGKLRKWFRGLIGAEDGK